jgi:glutamate racemase
VRILFDQGTPAPMRHLLVGHAIMTANELGWSTLKNGELLAAAEAEGFELFVTTDTNLKYQQNLVGRQIGVVVLGTTSWPRIKAATEWVVKAIDSAKPGAYLEIAIP